MLKRYLPTKWVGGKTIGTADVMNNIEEGINNVNDDLCVPSTSEDLLNENVNSFKVGTGTVEGIRKDYTEEMQSCLVSIDNIEGNTNKINNNFESISINSITTVSSVDFINPSKVIDLTSYNSVVNGNVTVDGSSIILESIYNNHSHLIYNNIQLSPNTEYIVVMNAENLSGTPYLDLWLDDNSNRIDAGNISKKDTNHHHDSGNWGQSSLVFTTGSTGIVRFNLYCNASDSFMSGKSVKFNSVIFYKTKRYLNLGRDLFLRSLPDGITKDRYSNGKIIKRVGYFVLDSNTQLTQVENSGEFKQFYVKLPNCKQGINIDINDFEFAGGSSDWAKQSSIGASTYNDQCLSISTDGCLYIKTITDSQPSFMRWLGNNITYIIYPLDVPEVISFDASILCDKTDYIFVDSAQPFTCTHKVSLNTKSQIEELQEVVQKEKKSVWHKLKELTSVKFNLSSNGYIKLPSLFGGFMIQWSSFNISLTDGIAKDVSRNFPISFNSDVYYLGTQLQYFQGNTWDVWRARVNGYVTSNSSYCVNFIRDDGYSGGTIATLKIFAIGR